MDKLVTITEASKILGVCTTTLRRWEKDGKLVPIRTVGNQRRYSLLALDPSFAESIESNRVTYAYARVSSHDQKEDLVRQAQVLEMHCAAQGWKFEIITDLGSGMNYHKKGLKKLLAEIIAGRVERLVIAHKDRLLRFGAELIFAICECKDVEVVIVNKGQDTTFEEDLAKDVLEIITVFSARLYGSRSNKNKKLIEAVQKAVETVI
ncbi:putative resolvase [Gammaproteobacteria bacterium]